MKPSTFFEGFVVLYETLTSTYQAPNKLFEGFIPHDFFFSVVHYDEHFEIEFFLKLEVKHHMSEQDHMYRLLFEKEMIEFT
jgi:hypothetical protein